MQLRFAATARSLPNIRGSKLVCDASSPLILNGTGGRGAALALPMDGVEGLKQGPHGTGIAPWPRPVVSHLREKAHVLCEEQLRQRRAMGCGRAGGAVGSFGASGDPQPPLRDPRAEHGLLRTSKHSSPLQPSPSTATRSAWERSGVPSARARNTRTTTAPPQAACTAHRAHSAHTHAHAEDTQGKDDCCGWLPMLAELAGLWAGWAWVSTTTPPLNVTQSALSLNAR
jgi:hypothetical protein